LAIEIVEILRRSTQGMTEPFICRGEDDALYFVKGRSKALGLPIAPFEVVAVAEELIDPLAEMRLSDLGAGLAFGSRQREYTSDILFSQLLEVPVDLRKAIMIFDRWIRNYDRTLSANGGNPNLLWATDKKSVVMIDHNNAFDKPVEGHVFAADHIFGREYLPLCHDRAEIAAYCGRLDAALEGWPGIVSSVPPEWLFWTEWKRFLSILALIMR
jgi:hypothetical protein